MKKRIDENSLREHFPRSRLEPFSSEEVKYLKGTADFFGLNHYTSLMATSSNAIFPVPSYWNDVGAFVYKDPSWAGSAAPWLNVVPWGFRKLLKWIKVEYNNPEIYVTENGYADYGELNDEKRIDYHKVIYLL